MLWAPWPTVPDSVLVAELCRPDERVLRLRSFFERFSSPAAEFAGDFVQAADFYALDWRLLPSISMVESSGGKYYANNNIFGWDSCRTGFPTVREGIYHVASRLATSRIYKGKNLDGILRLYNPGPDYDDLVMRYMAALGDP
jgi:hypothetical protein